MSFYKRVHKALNGRINRRQYIFLFVLGLIIAPIKILAALYIVLYFSEVLGFRAFGVIVGIFGFMAVGLYFYIIKIKRLHDIGLGDQALLISQHVPAGDTALNAILFGKKSSQAAKKKVLSLFESKSELFLVGSLFILLLAIYLVIFYSLINGLK